jgi:hypothetical protein
MSVAERKIPVPRYPESAAHEMKFNAGVFSFTVARADNGFIFQEYDAQTDEIDMVTQEAVMLFKNSNAFMQNISTQYDDSFGVRAPRSAPACASACRSTTWSPTARASRPRTRWNSRPPCTVATQRHVDLTFTSAEQTLKVDDYTDRFLLPAMNNLAGNVASTVMAGSEGGICNIVANFNGSRGHHRARRWRRCWIRRRCWRTTRPRAGPQVRLDPTPWRASPARSPAC